MSLSNVDDNVSGKIILTTDMGTFADKDYLSIYLACQHICRVSFPLMHASNTESDYFS